MLNIKNGSCNGFQYGERKRRKEEREKEIGRKCRREKCYGQLSNTAQPWNPNWGEIWTFHTPMSSSEVSPALMFTHCAERQFSLRPDGSHTCMHTHIPCDWWACDASEFLGVCVSRRHAGWWQAGSSGRWVSGCIINRPVWHLTASEVTVSSPLAGRQSASGSPEHVLVPTADCPEDISHIIQPNQRLGLTQRPKQRQLRDRVQGWSLPNEAELPLRADGGQDKAHPAQGYDLPYAEAFLQRRRSKQERADGHVLIQPDWCRPWQLNWFLYSMLDIFICLLNRICCSNSTDGCKCVSFKCQSLVGQYNCVSENATAGVTGFNLSWTFCGILLRCVE